MADTKNSNATPVMGPEQFREWRRSLGLKQKEAAEQLGLKKRMIQYYEKGKPGRPAGGDTEVDSTRVLRPVGGNRRF